MKKRIIVFNIITVLFALLILTSSFVALVNVNEIEKTKSLLSSYNKIMILNPNFTEKNLENFKINNVRVRFTLIDKNGNVKFDSSNKDLENHFDREEIIEAIKKDEASITRFSKTEGVNLVYYANKLDDDIIIRSAVPLSTVKVLSLRYFKYYILVIILVLLLSLGLSLKLVRAIIYPIKELETATAKIANGDFNRRAKIHTNDEVGSLAHTFNNMADQLQVRISDSLDKQNKLESILESMESGVIAIDKQEKIMLINPYAKRVFGLNKNIIGKNIGEYIIDYDLIKFIKDTPEIETVEVKILHPFERELRIKKAPIINSIKLPIGTVIAVQDITDIKRLENMRSQFVANVSHELRTPLTSIKGFAETLKYVKEDETKNKFLDIIDKEADRLTRLINDILVLSNIENNNNVLEVEFDPNEVITEAINMVSGQAVLKNTKIEILNNYKGLLVGDRDKFFQLILNLVENAIKYSGEESNVLVKSYNVNDYIYIEVADNGFGIPKEDLPRIFERFYRVDKSRAKGGTGLGLAIVKHIVKIFNGEIYVDSNVGFGTKFTVKIKKIY
ncbi:sensor histidine kinase [Clostridium gasigenes]|uniref:histidine kinase n=1 Tax=Clostridium gasigenes TaxID=94869 RepID=A0A1H0RDH2_9CLOT|nr:ATP-binding protein [Clostridium gasigenes]MBB6623036.1 HAMP domain-containing protein [Clostridium gasigenes]MBU3087806.1 HAMP domain-containing protein [Clostridium gasigenes]MBU3132509.1 HAMP domain-containing protein [Clostridium gasigenes]SDP27455.1 two-component system, OmpR family, phosphate regulon sensor histidine kinase PhoR [Clostridium gasigenes]